MRSISNVLLLSTLITIGTYAEKLEFTHTLAPTASQCFLENLGEAVNGKLTLIT